MATVVYPTDYRDTSAPRLLLSMRSFLLAEQFFRPSFSDSSPMLQEPDSASKEAKKKPNTNFGLGMLWHGVVEQLSVAAHSAKERLLPRKEFTIWTSQRYFDAWALSQSSDEQAAIYKELDPDLESLFDEHAFNKLAVRYEYGPNGIRNGYSQSMIEIAQNFLEHLRIHGLSTERAELEVAVAEAATAWMNDLSVQVGEKIVFMSPRGSEAELYPGLQEENHVFVNILEKTATGFIFYEFRNYDTHQALPLLQQRIVQKSGGSSQKISTLHPEYYTQHIITNFVQVPATFSVSDITNEIYFNKLKWKINIDTQIPNLNEAAVQAHSAQVRDFCVRKFKELTTESLTQSEKVAAFDLLIVLVRKELNKWVENNATNYDATKQIEYALHLDVVENIWQIQRKKQAGADLEHQEKAALRNFLDMTQLNPALPFQRMTSLAHCIVGTPTSLLKIQAMPNLTSSVVSLNGFEANIFSQLSLKERQEYITELKRYARISLQGEVWYVPPEYLAGKGCYVDPATGLVMGPCGLALSDPRETNAKREEDYFALLGQLQSTSELDSKLDSLSASQKELVLALYFSLVKWIFVASASFEKIFHCDILRPESEIKAEFKDVYRALREAFNPLPQLVLYLAEKAQFDQDEFSKLEASALGITT